MEEQEFSYWVIEYMSCESNERWCIAKAPVDWDSYDVKNRIPMGGYGDDVAEVKEVYKTTDTDYSWDFCD